LITLKLSAEGELRVIKSIQNVIGLWKEGADGKIVMVEDAGITTLGPVLPKLAGVVCTSGALGSHLAIGELKLSPSRARFGQDYCVKGMSEDPSPNKRRILAVGCLRS